MRTRWALVIGVVLASAVVAGAQPQAGARATAGPAASPPGFAVVELFTSEGCSICSPSIRWNGTWTTLGQWSTARAGASAQ